MSRSNPQGQHQPGRGEPNVRRCQRCKAILAADNSAQLCGRCLREHRDQLRTPPVPQPGFFDTPEFRAAFDSQEIGRVFRAYRNHPRHLHLSGKALGQEVLGSWLGLSQTQVSKLENGRSEHNLDTLRNYARILHLPESLLWFDFPGQSRNRLVAVQATEGRNSATPSEAGLADAERLVNADPNMAGLLEWIDTNTDWNPGTARQKLVSKIAVSDRGELSQRRHRRLHVKQSQIAEALSAYYGPHPEYRIYRGRCRDESLVTTILTREEWLDLGTPLTAAADCLRLTSVGEAGRPQNLDEFAAGHAIGRLAEAVISETRIYNLPLYRLLDVNVRSGLIGGTVAMGTFADYAFTSDLLENEITDAVAVEKPIGSDDLPLRRRYLPDISSVVDLPSRLCAGGALALFAVARASSPHRPADYVVLIQERSGHVVNSARRLSLTQGFHQPMIDYRAETQISLTLMRELEEEMFGREELDNTVSNHRGADPMHPTRLTAPMCWLTEIPGRMRIEATAFGFNLVNGNYEFANIVVVEDEEFWDRFGGHIEANWEAGSVRRYSSHDGELMEALISDPAWTNEGLFTLLQGLRRLAEIDPERVNLPAIDWTLD